jgi:uncharacterized membrane protein
MADVVKQPVTGGSNDVEDNKVIAAIGYLGILCLVPLLAKKDSPFAQYHGKQGLVLFIASIIISVVWVIPFLGWIIGMVGGLAVFIFLIMGLMNALGGKMVPLPVIGQYADKINL